MNNYKIITQDYADLFSKNGESENKNNNSNNENENENDGNENDGNSGLIEEMISVSMMKCLVDHKSSYNNLKKSLLEIYKIAEIRKYNKRTSLIKTGDDSDIFILYKGAFIIVSNGIEIFRMKKKGDIVGEEHLMLRKNNMLETWAEKDSIIFYIQNEKLNKLFKSKPDAIHIFYQLIILNNYHKNIFYTTKIINMITIIMNDSEKMKDTIEYLTEKKKILLSSIDSLIELSDVEKEDNEEYSIIYDIMISLNLSIESIFSEMFSLYNSFMNLEKMDFFKKFDKLENDENKLTDIEQFLKSNPDFLSLMKTMIKNMDK